MGSTIKSYLWLCCGVFHQIPTLSWVKDTKEWRSDALSPSGSEVCLIPFACPVMCKLTTMGKSMYFLSLGWTHHLSFHFIHLFVDWMLRQLHYSCCAYTWIPDTVVDFLAIKEGTRDTERQQGSFLLPCQQKANKLIRVNSPALFYLHPVIHSLRQRNILLQKCWSYSQKAVCVYCIGSEGRMQMCPH